MMTIRPLLPFNRADLQRLITGYVSDERYAVSWQETATNALFALELTQLDQPYTHTYDPFTFLTIPTAISPLGKLPFL
jgi:hypothetical protein